MTLTEVADHYCVSPETVRRGSGVLGRLRQVQITDGRVLIPRADVDKLDRYLERIAIALVED